MPKSMPRLTKPTEVSFFKPFKDRHGFRGAERRIML